MPAVALVELFAQWVIEARVPKPAHWRAAHDHIARARREGDLVASAPVWTDPLARMYFRDLIAMRDAAVAPPQPRAHPERTRPHTVHTDHGSHDAPHAPDASAARPRAPVFAPGGDYPSQ